MKEFKIVTKTIHGREVEVKVYELGIRSETFITAGIFLNKKKPKELEDILNFYSFGKG